MGYAVQDLGASDPNPMLTGERPFELKHQGRCFVGDEAEFLQILGTVHVEHGPHMQKTRGGVTVETGGDVLSF